MLISSSFFDLQYPQNIDARTCNNKPWVIKMVITTIKLNTNNVPNILPAQFAVLPKCLHLQTAFIQPYVSCVFCCNVHTVLINAFYRMACTCNAKKSFSLKITRKLCLHCRNLFMQKIAIDKDFSYVTYIFIFWCFDSKKRNFT